MNIKEASIQIKNAMQVYFMKDEAGNYLVPPEKQRPIFLVGAPGIGKTAIMEQIAEELQVGLISYSMTHHTRQSALGLPYITEKNFGGKEYQVSEYTMSEIIASVYNFMEQTGKKEGILFLDEINCVSETLTPSMLQFLQYKIFGTHSVPAGWIVVTAGNPTEFNRSAKEFDIATLDRLKKIEVEPNYGVWREYAVKKGAHPAVINYLDKRENDFYRIESTPAGKSYVTARGWEDLSAMMILYEKAGIDITQELVSQYVNNRKIASDFTDSYFLYKKYMDFYEPEKILNGDFGDTADRARNGSADEKLSIVGFILERICANCESAVKNHTAASNAVKIIKQYGGITETEEYIAEKKAQLADLADRHCISSAQSAEEYAVLKVLSDIIADAKKTSIPVATKKIGEAIKEQVTKTQSEMSNAIGFITLAFGEERETVLFISGLEENRYSSKFIRTFGCGAYSEITKKTGITNKHDEIMKRIENM